MHSPFWVKPDIGGKCNGFVLYGGVHIHGRPVRLWIRFWFQVQSGREAEHEFAPLLANPILKPGHLARVNRQSMPELRHFYIHIPNYGSTALRLLQLLIATEPIIYSVAERKGDWYGEQKVCQTIGMR